MARESSIFRQIGFGIVALLLAAALILAVLTWQANHRLDAKLAALRAEGEPTSLAELAPKPIPPEQNAAVILQSISADLEAFAKDEGAFAKTPEGEAYDAAQERGDPPTAEQLAAMQTILDRYPRLLPALKQAAGCESYASLLDFNLPQERFQEASLQSYSPKRNLARFAHWKMIAIVHEGKPDEAIRLGLQVVRLSRMYESETGLISYLVGIACLGIAVEGINEALRADPVSAEVHAELEQELARQDDSHDLASPLKRERAMSVSSFGSFAEKGGPAIAHLLTWKMKSWQSDILDYYDTVLPFADKSWFEAKGGLAHINASIANAAPLVALLAPSLQAVFDAANRDLASLRSLRILNALCEFKEKQGHDASGLVDLALPRAATIDPFSGVPLKLKSTPTGWVIYSVMKDGVDDGGDFKNMKDWGIAPAGYKLQDRQEESTDTPENQPGKTDDSPSSRRQSVETGDR